MLNKQTMTTLINAVTRPSQLYWWQWMKILGLFLPALFAVLRVEHLLLWAVAVHFFVDFTTQSDETAAGKARGDWWVLAYHAFVAGGYPGLIVGGWPGLAISATIHFLVDVTNKFGLDNRVGLLLDQAAHIITLVVIWWLYRWGL